MARYSNPELNDEDPTLSKRELADATRAFFVATSITLGLLATIVGLLEIGHQRRGEVLQAFHFVQWVIAGILFGRLGAGPASIAVGGDQLWVWFRRLDPRTGRLRSPLRPGFDAEHLWVVVLKGPPSPWQPALLFQLAPG